MSASHKGRRKLLVGIATVGLTLGASGAYAFWIGGGEAGGSAVVGSQSGALIEIRQLNQPIGLVPDGPRKTIKIGLTNPDPDPNVPVYIYGVHVSIPADWAPDADGEGPLTPCTALDFDLGDAVFDGYVSGTDPEELTEGTIRLKDRGPQNPELANPDEDPNNQESCRGVTVPLILTPMYEQPQP